MSFQAVCKTSIKDEQDLIDIVHYLLGQRCVIKHDVNIPIMGYSSDKQVKIEIKLKGLYGTAGFYVDENNEYQLVYDSSDYNTLKPILRRNLKQDGKEVVLDPIAQEYAKRKVYASVYKMNGNVLDTVIDKNGNMKIKIKL